MARVLTTKDLERFYTGAEGHPFLDLFDFREVMKTAGDMTTSVAGVWNPIYGAQVWAQLNLEANLFGILPKTTWVRSGWRVIKSLANTLGTGGVAEDAALPTEAYPDIELVKTKPKQAVHTFAVSDIVQALSELGEDDVWGNIDEVRAYFGFEHRRHINAMLGTDVDTPAGNNFESIDRVVSGNAEATLVSDPTDVNIYGIDRATAASWADAVIDHNSGTARALTEEMLRTNLATIRKNGGNTTVIVTGYDTYAKIQGLFTQFVRYEPYLGEARIQVGVNGVQTAEGVDAGLKVATLYGLPLIASQDVPATGGTISNIYMLDTSDPEGYGLPRLGFSVVRPTEYFETRDPFIAGKFAVKGAYRTTGEVICRFFRAQGKIRDIQ